MPKSFKSRKLEVRPSPIHGKGVFSIKPIAIDEIVWIRSGNVVSYTEANHIDSTLGDFSLQVEEEYFLSPTSIENLNNTAIFFNHSCNPNVRIDGQITFVANRPINPNEELTVDFSTIEARSEFRLKCSCGGSSCRKLVTGDDWKRPDIQLRYKGSFSLFIERRILGLSNSNNSMQPIADAPVD